MISRIGKFIFRSKPKEIELGPILKKIKDSTLPDKWSVIAHAGGGLQFGGRSAITYSNSIQSIDESIRDGKILIELDLSLTADNRIVAVHNWKEFKADIGYNNIKLPQLHTNEPLNYAEFKKAKYHNELDTVGIDDINNIFRNNPQLILVVDKIRDIKALVEQFEFVNRIMIEVFDIKSFNMASELGIDNIIFSINIKNKNIVDWVTKNKIKAVAFNAKALDSNKRALKNAMQLYQLGIVTLAYTTNDARFISNHRNVTVSAVYSDYWSLKENKILPVGGSVTY